MRTTPLRASAVAVVAFVGLLASPTPASAHLMSGGFMGTMQTSGTWAPAAPPCGAAPCSATGTWSFGSSFEYMTTNGEEPTAGSGRISWSGLFNGWCGNASGTVTLNVLGELLTVDWRHSGSIVIFTTLAGSGHSWVLGGGVMKPAAGTGNCVTSVATVFDISGGITVAP